MGTQRYADEMGELERERAGLDEEEDVFDLPATQYPGLDQVVLIMTRLKKVFNIYQQLRVGCFTPFLSFSLSDRHNRICSTNIPKYKVLSKNNLHEVYCNCDAFSMGYS